MKDLNQRSLEALLARHRARPETPSWLLNSLEHLMDRYELLGEEGEEEEMEMEFLYPH